MASTAPGFSPDFLDFLRQNHIDPQVYTAQQTLPRYVRIQRHHKRTDAEISSIIKQVSADAQCTVARVPGVPGFLSIADQTIRMSQLQSSRNGDIVGMDVSSGIAAYALGAEPGDNVLDLCCAPGAKLLLFLEILGESRGTVTGVDVSPHRIATCRSLVKKHGGLRKGFVRLFAADGTSFDQRAPQSGWWDPEVLRQQTRRESTGEEAPERPWFAPKLLSTRYALGGSELYDRVLVDAECTHDGSLAHIQKYKDQWHLLDKQVINDGRARQVPILQSRLLENGWRLLKPGGVLVYSTCSLSRFQNELVVGGFLDRHPADEARVDPIPFADGEIATSAIWQPESDEEWSHDGLDRYQRVVPRMHSAVRLDPRVSNTSGMFITRITKLRSEEPPVPEAIRPLALPE
ncbi:hypothetical protein GGF46_004459 [Coemansia sp. RSA 552]|nr:hypothetical protein GGF46_004459 [Coemansia sp. RSA 552]